MSNLYPDLIHTNFPESIDHYEDMVDIDLSLKPLVDQYYTLYNAGDFTGIASLLESNPALDKALYNAKKHNRNKDDIEAIKRFYRDDVQSYLVNIIKNKGDFVETTKYTKYDVVGYVISGAKQWFMGVSTNIPLGTLPTNETYFTSLTLRGEQGASGVGLSFRSNWSNITQYYSNDCVVHNNTLWWAKKNNINSVPQDVSTDWEKLFLVVDSIEFTDEIPTEPLPREADLLGGHDTSYFATAEQISTVSGNVTNLQNSFNASLVVSITGENKSGVTVTATKGTTVVNGTTNSNGNCTLTITELGTYAITYSKTMFSATTSVNASSYSYYSITGITKDTVYLYQLGNECLAKTGGWEVFAGQYAGGTVTKNSDRITMNANVNVTHAGVVTAIPIDLTYATSLKIDINVTQLRATGNNVFICESKTGTGIIATLNLSTTGRSVRTLDVGSITGLHYIYVDCFAYQTVYCSQDMYNLYLE